MATIEQIEQTYTKTDQSVADIRADLKAKIRELEREYWHSDDRSRRSMLNGLNVALRVVEKHML